MLVSEVPRRKAGIRKVSNNSFSKASTENRAVRRKNVNYPKQKDRKNISK